MQKLKNSKGLLLLFSLLSSSILMAQDEGFIYGRIITEDNNTYEGPIRWGKEEVYWSDMFNASKKKNTNLKYLSDDEISDLKDHDGDIDFSFFENFFDIDIDDNFNFTHEFSIAFGNIKSLTNRGSSKVAVELKNGKSVLVSGSGYNDIGSKINVIDPEIGLVEISWRNIDKVEFMSTPSKLTKKFGEPLYGVVKCNLGKFTGFVQWDKDERVGDDKLDGDQDGDDFSIDFSKIKSISKINSSKSLVTLKSDRKLELEGSNDVNKENNGIIVTVKELGRVELEWDEFESVTFIEIDNSGRSYDSYNEPSYLKGKVVVDNGDELTGLIAYDLDENMNIEVLNGEVKDVSFIIPFYNISSIEPDGPSMATVTLTSGDEMVLRESQDVTKENHGVLLKTSDDYIYVPWRRVEKVSFR